MPDRNPLPPLLQGFARKAMALPGRDECKVKRSGKRDLDARAELVQQGSAQSAGAALRAGGNSGGSAC
jgi:hypothetical protein